MIRVVKRDRTLEDFDKKKIARVVAAAGLEIEKANDLADRVDLWVTQNSQEAVTSLQIRDKVLEELKKVSSYAAGLFEWYEKTKDGKGSS